MEDNQYVVSETSNATNCPLTGDNVESNLDTTRHGEAEPALSNALLDGSNPDENVYRQNQSPVSHQVANGASYQSNGDDGAPGDAENISCHENMTGVSTYPVNYNTLNGNSSDIAYYQSTGVVENGNLPTDMGAPVLEQHYEDVACSADEERLWNMVRVNCLDFNAWTALIEETEKVAEANILKIRKVYDAFLAEFPLCFGYWKKYADHEGRLGSVDKVLEVYEQAVLAVTYSVEIWVNYCQFAISTYDDPDIIRRLFDRGLAYVGTDFHSDLLWDEYIRYEESHQAWSHLAMIYTRILEHPIQQLDRYFNCFKELVASRPLSELQTAEEDGMLAASLDSGSQGFEGEVHSGSVDQFSKPVSAGLTEAEELEKYVAIREEMYRKAKEYESKITGFETAIRRPYFHVRPLDDPELENWHNYLDFIERGDDFNKVVKLYERCLIACASYPEYWIRYVLCMEASGSIELANNALARATQVFVKKQPDIHLFAARFKERSGDASGARAQYQLLYSEISPGLLEAIVKHANMEYRLGDKESCFSVFEKAIAAEQEKEHSQLLPMLLVQYSRFLLLVADNIQKARDVLGGPLGQMKLSKPILEAVIHLESINQLPKRVEYLDSLVEKFITPDPENIHGVATLIEREEISSILLEFLDLFGDAQSIKKADNRHAMLFARQRSFLASKKRAADESLASDKSKLAKTGDAGQSIMGAYPNAQGQWPSNYVRPSTSQAQGQQWTAGYTQQAVYPGYGSYGNYGPQQMPTSAPQAGAYSGYPTTPYSQAYSQQSYVQPAAGASATVAANPQQPAQASHSQAFYGSYY